ncbi:hypothetical protein OPV22_018025 [Ensete ventricosum]|uniref:Uncharacterized protein n=1 Tax=Ensete ventricosum TaxID=4639 RepID=A0AAV8QV01_ENSVE|nr:hypothetical protein OPV22_018025 [Ensete ventricosum]
MGKDGQRGRRVEEGRKEEEEMTDKKGRGEKRGDAEGGAEKERRRGKRKGRGKGGGEECDREGRVVGEDYKRKEVARKKAVVQIGVAGGGLRQRNPDDESHLPRAGVGGRSGCAAEVERHEAVWQVPLEL